MVKALELSELELDLLTELFNLGVGNAANSLSTMVKQEIELSVPEILFLKQHELASKIGHQNSICSVSQNMSGPFTAQTMLLFPEDNSLEVVRQLLGSELPDDTLLELQKEALSEIGNIVLNACINSFSNAIKEEFKVELPGYELSNPADLFNRSADEEATALFIRISMKLRKSHISCYMAFLMGELSLQHLKKVLEKTISNL